MSNHPWRTGRRYFNCEPDCPERKPGCQDHCERHANDKSKWDKMNAVKRRYDDVRHYTAEAVSKNLDYVAKKQGKWKRYHKHSGS